MIRVVCVCGRVFKAEDRHMGQRTRCPACGAGLIIGRTPASGSSAGDLNEAPSWCYPSEPTAGVGAEAARAPGWRDPESLPTAVIGPGMAPARQELASGPDAGRGTSAVATGPGRRLWTVAGAAAAVLLAFGVLYGMHVIGPGRGGAMASRVMPGGPRSRDAGETGPGAVSDRGLSRAVPDGRAARRPRRLRLLVPAYIYPAGEGRKQWRRLIDAAGKVDLLLVVNPDSGPGAERNPDYTAVIAEAAGRGVKLVGYVNTGFGQRPAAEVKADVDTWVRLYPRIGGFFLDQQSPDAGHAADYADLGAYARGKIRDALVIGNPGVPCDEAYLARRAADMVCIFAKPDGFDVFELPATLKEYDPSRIAALVYQIADEEVMRSMLKEAIIKGIGYVYVTDGKWPNPWDQLPAYWEAEVEALARLQ
jgi:hypothetical protein